MSDARAPQLTDKQRREIEDVVELAAQDARIIKEARMLRLPPDGALTKEQIDGVRAAVRDYIETKGISRQQVGREINRAASAVGQFINGAYMGDSATLARMLNTWMEQHERGDCAGMPQELVMTSIATRIIAVMQDAQAAGVINLILGPAGVSKSMCARAAVRGVIPGSLHLECTEAMRSPGSFMRAWASKLGLGIHKPLWQLEMDIITRLRSSRKLQILDEVPYLSTGAFNIVRDVHKQSECGIVIMGTVDAEQRINDFQEFHGQFTSLINIRYDIAAEQSEGGDPLYSVEEIVKLATSMGLRLTDDGAEELTELACVPGWGGLRMSSRTLRKAKLFARHKKRSAISAADITAAIRSLRGRDHSELLETRRQQVQQRRARVA